MRKTKIVCTMGPATDREEVLLELIESGMDVARFNFSHGSHEEQKKRMQMLCRLRKQCGRPVAMLLDTTERLYLSRGGSLRSHAGM